MPKDLLDPNPFANPILATKGNSQARQIYLAVGFALDRWEHCDTRFGSLYSSLIDTRGGNWVLMRSFGIITSATTRKEMIWHACDAHFAGQNNDELKARTHRLLNLYKDAASRRNEIAHAMVMGAARHKIVNNAAVPLPPVWFLVPPLFATRKRVSMSVPKFKYSATEIDHFTACFEELGSRAGKLAQAIRAFRALSPEKP